MSIRIFAITLFAVDLLLAARSAPSHETIAGASSYTFAQLCALLSGAPGTQVHLDVRSGATGRDVTLTLKDYVEPLLAISPRFRRSSASGFATSTPRKEPGL
ncbi:MAG: hypothetical protein ACYDA5_10480 [Vulcanimicrobiaceae bacterium]